MKLGAIFPQTEIGATHLSVNTMNAGFSTVKEHIDAAQRVKEVVSG